MKSIKLFLMKKQHNISPRWGVEENENMRSRSAKGDNPLITARFTLWALLNKPLWINSLKKILPMVIFAPQNWIEHLHSSSSKRRTEHCTQYRTINIWTQSQWRTCICSCSYLNSSTNYTWPTCSLRWMYDRDIITYRSNLAMNIL